jgi:hyperosmotically inducible periplasmic protein
MKVLCSAAIVTMLMAAGCTQSEMERRSASRTTTSADLEQSVKSRIASNSALANADVKVSADADKKQITLTGTVPTEEMRMQAVAAAKSAAPDATIEDKIDVKPREMSRADYTPDMARNTREKAKASGQKVGDSIDDAWIHTVLTTKFATSSTVPARKIDIDVENNTVTLRGEVDSAAARQEAEQIAKNTDGVKAVRNLIKVQNQPSL